MSRKACTSSFFLFFFFIFSPLVDYFDHKYNFCIYFQKKVLPKHKNIISPLMRLQWRDAWHYHLQNICSSALMIGEDTTVNYCFSSNLDTAGTEAETRASTRSADMLTHMLDTDNSVTHFKLRPPGGTSTKNDSSSYSSLTSADPYWKWKEEEGQRAGSYGKMGILTWLWDKTMCINTNRPHPTWGSWLRFLQPSCQVLSNPVTIKVSLIPWYFAALLRSESIHCLLSWGTFMMTLASPRHSEQGLLINWIHGHTVTLQKPLARITSLYGTWLRHH